MRIRAFNVADLQDCREVFTQGMEQLITLIARVVFPKYVWPIAAVTVFFLVLAAFQWTITIFLPYIFTCAVILTLLYIHVYMECWKFINSCLATDLKDIVKTYMSRNDGSRMWVAEWNGKVVGMVGLIHNEIHKPGVAELQRMSVSPACRRMGIARKLLDELLRHAKDQRFETLVLTTTSAQTPAILLYKKFGFKLVAVFPYPQKILGDLQYCYFELQL